jgi:hypothetical protein
MPPEYPEAAGAIPTDWALIESALSGGATLAAALAPVVAPVAAAAAVVAAAAPAYESIGATQYSNTQALLQAMGAQDAAQAIASQEMFNQQQLAYGQQELQRWTSDQSISADQMMTVQQLNALSGIGEDVKATSVGAAIDNIINTSASAAEAADRVYDYLTTAGYSDVEARSAAQDVYGLKGADLVRDSAAAAAAAAATAAGVRALDTDYADTMAMNPAIPWTGALTGAGLLAGLATLSKTLPKSQHKQQLSCFETTGEALADAALKTALPAAMMAAWALSPQLRDIITSLAAKAVDVLYSPLERQAPITPEKAPGVGVAMLLEAVELGAAAHMASATAEAYGPLKNLGLGYLSAFMVDMAGFSRIAAAFQGQMINWGLMQPMRYYSLERFRPMIPREDQLLRLAGEYAITRDEFNRSMAYHGYSQERIDQLYELADRALSPLLFRYLGEAGILDEGLLDRELKNAGYNAKTIPYLKTWLGKVAAGELKGAFQGAATKRFRIGLDDEDELVANLDELGFSGTQLEKAVRAARLDRATELAEDTKKLYLDQFTKGYIEDYDLELRLSGLGYCPEVVSIEVARAALKRKPKPEAPVAPGVEKETRELQARYVTLYTELYRKDKLTEDQFFNYLVTLGIGEELASVTVSIESAKKLPKVKA